MSEGVERPRGPQSHSGGSSEEQNTDSENQAKEDGLNADPLSGTLHFLLVVDLVVLQTIPGPLFLNLNRCSSCYNHKKRLRRDSDGESSSSAEGSGAELDSDLDEESSSASSCSESVLSETNEKPETEEPVENVEADLGDKTGEERQKEVGETSESMDNKGTTMSGTRRPPLLKSYSLPSSFPPQLIPWSRLPRPRTIVTTLQLQCLSQKQDDDPFHIIQKHVFDQIKTEENSGEGRKIINPPYPLSPPTNRLLRRQKSLQSSQQQQSPYPHQQPMLELSHEYQQQQPHYFDPLSAQGQVIPPPPHTLPVLHPQLIFPPMHNPLVQMYTSLPQPYWYSMQNPHTY